MKVLDGESTRRADRELRLVDEVTFLWQPVLFSEDDTIPMGLYCTGCGHIGPVGEAGTTVGCPGCGRNGKVPAQ